MKIIILFTLFLLTTSATNANEPNRTVKVSFGEALPPWVISKTNSGIIISLLKRCLEPSGYIVEPLYHPYARRLVEYINNNVDAVIDVNSKVIMKHNLKGYFSGNMYSYENYAYALKKNKVSLDGINSLKNYSLLSWQGAVDHLGGEYAKMAKKHPRYKEISKQKGQVQMLFLNRYDVVQMDSQIFEYYKKIISKEGKVNTDLAVDKFAFFGKSPNGFIFRFEKHRDACIKNLKR